MKLKILILFSLLILVLTACQFPVLNNDTDGETSNVLFQDDFSDPTSGWDRVSSESGETDYVDGAYRIYVNETNTDVWANPGLTFTDVRIEVDATKAGGPDDNDFGVTCRVQDASHFYFFIISSDGYYAIGKTSDEAQDLIGMDAMLPNEAINQGQTDNHIRADCIGDTLTLYVNGQKLDEVHDSEFKSGDVGLMAGSFGTPGTDVHFDNFTVLNPETQESSQ
jgi:hypothetical protein